MLGPGISLDGLIYHANTETCRKVYEPKHLYFVVFGLLYFVRSSVQQSPKVAASRIYFLQLFPIFLVSIMFG